MGRHNADVSNYYNRTARTQRLLLSEETYEGGIKYTTNPLPEGYSKLLVNFSTRKGSSSLFPRDGIISNGTNTAISNWNNIDVPEDPVHEEGITTFTEPTAPKIHIAYTGSWVDYNDLGHNTDVALCCGNPTVTSDGITYFNLKSGFADLSIQNNNGETTHEIVLCPDTISAFYIRGTTINAPKDRGLVQIVKQEPVYCVMNGRLYVWGTTDLSDGFKLYRIDFKQATENADIKFVPEEIEPNPSGNVNTGYNLLNEDPYHFENTESGALKINLLQMYDEDNVYPKQYYRANDKVVLNGFYMGDPLKAYTYKFESRTIAGNSDWVLIGQGTVSNLGDIACDYTIPDTDTIVKLTITEPLDPGQITSTSVNATLTIEPNSYNSLGFALLDMSQRIDLSTCTHMLATKGAILLWGVKNHENILYSSTTDIPNEFLHKSIYSFDEDIVVIKEYLSNLIVITTKKVYLLNLGIVESGNILQSATLTTINESIGVQEVDYNTVQAVNDIVFFGSDDKFYIIKPVAVSGTYTLKVQEVSIDIADFIDDFDGSIESILYNLYDITTTKDTQIIDTKSYVEDAKVHIIYKIKTHIEDIAYWDTWEEIMTHTRYIDIDLVYDTTNKIWFLNMWESNLCMVPYKPINSTKYLFYTVTGEVTDEKINYKARQYEFSESNKHDTKDLGYSIMNPIVLNYQYLDTGAREYDQYHNKRYRELDLIMNNRSGQHLTFSLGFKLDGQTRQGSVSYSVEHDTDPDSTTYGVLTYIRQNADNISIDGRTNLDIWELDSSEFPELDKVKVRFKISGKGYYAQYTLMSKNEEDFELLSHVWVYRPMFAR